MEENNTPSSTCHDPLNDSTSKIEDDDLLDQSTFCKDQNQRNVSKKVKIVEPKLLADVESDEDDSMVQSNVFERSDAVTTGASMDESATPASFGQFVDQSLAAANDRKKSKEERKKEREKKKEEEMLKKYQAEQEAKQKISAKSKCGRWIKHNLKIGEGGYKFVYRGYDSVEARNVAWCEFKREHVDTKEKRQAMFKETEIMLKMNHPHIVRCFDVFREWINMEDPNNQIEEKGLVIIQELMGEGTLKSVIRKNFLDGQCILKFPLITRWWHQILDALRYMHHKIQPPILHRDLKADNCFLYGASDEAYLNVKVGDFGLATHVSNSGRKTMLGTLGFMAPEIFEEKYDEKVDIYAFGMLMLEVMTNRTPYDECESVLQVAAKTMSGQGPDIMQMVCNPSLREVICACVQPLTCFRPNVEELYFHPLFQPKTLPVEVEPNYDNATDREEVLDRFVRSLGNVETRNPNFNLRLRFRDKKMLQELGLDDGESLEFDLDIYKAEDQDIPDLIHNLRLGYEDKLWRVFENPKQPDKKIVSNHLDKLFSSIRLQMQFLVKVLLGKRWNAILDSLVQEQKNRKKQEGTSAVDEDNESDADSNDTSSFTLIGKYKSKWNRAKKLLDKEIQAYRNASCSDPSGSTSTTTTPTLTTSAVSQTSVSNVGSTDSYHASAGNNVPQTNATAVPVQVTLPSANAYKNVSPDLPTTSVESVNSTQNQTATCVSTVGKFVVSSSPGVSAAPSSSSVSVSVTLASGNAPAPVSTTVLQTPVSVQKPMESQSYYQASGNAPFVSSAIPHVDQNTRQVVDPNPQQYQFVKSQQPVQTAAVFNSNVQPQQALIKQDTDITNQTNIDNVTRSAIILQQVLQGISGNPNEHGTLQPHQPQATQAQQQQLVLAAAAAVAEQAAVAAASVACQSAFPLQTQQPQQQQQQQSVFSMNQEPIILNQPMLSDVQQPPQGHQYQHHSLSLQQTDQLQQQIKNLVMPSSNIPNQVQVAMQQPSNIPANMIFQHNDSVAPVPQQQQQQQPPPAPTSSEILDNYSKLDINPDQVALINQLTGAIISNSDNLSNPTNVIYANPTHLNSLIFNQQHAPQPLISMPQPVSQFVNQQPPQTQTTHSQLTHNVFSKPLNERRTRNKTISKPRYILRVIKLERDLEGIDPGNLRPTFYLEMPDLNNPNSELWKISFRCNLSDTPNDIKLFQGSGFTSVNEDIDRAAKDAVMNLLELLRRDVNLVKLNHDYVFYPLNSGTYSQSDSNNLSNTGGRSSSTTRFSRISSQEAALPTNQSMLNEGIGGSLSYEEVKPIDQKSNTNLSAGFKSVGGNVFNYSNDDDDGDDEYSEASRLISPIETQNNQPVDSNAFSAYKNSQNNLTTSYYNAPPIGSEQTGLDLNHQFNDAINNPQSDVGIMNNNLLLSQTQQNYGLQNLLPLSLNVINDLISLATTNRGSNLLANQFGLEEVSPLNPSNVADPNSTTTTNTRNEGNLHKDYSSYDQMNLNQLENVLYQSSASHLPYPQTQMLTGGPSSTIVNQNKTMSNLCANNSECLINANFTIPSYLEPMLKELVSKISMCPTRTHVVIPTLETNDCNQNIQFRVAEIQDSHMYFGVSSGQIYNNMLSTFKNPSHKPFALVSLPQNDGSFQIPQIYRPPEDAVLLLTHNGKVHFIKGPSIVVPIQESGYSVSPLNSPTHDSSANRNRILSAYVRELPIPTDFDTFTFDDVLTLLLALRDATHTFQPHQSSTASPSLDSQTVPHPDLRSIAYEGIASDLLSRRSSAATSFSQYNPTMQSSTNNIPQHNQQQIHHHNLSSQQQQQQQQQQGSFNFITPSSYSEINHPHVSVFPSVNQSHDVHHQTTSSYHNQPPSRDSLMNNSHAITTMVSKMLPPAFAQQQQQQQQQSNAQVNLVGSNLVGKSIQDLQLLNALQSAAQQISNQKLSKDTQSNLQTSIHQLSQILSTLNQPSDQLTQLLSLILKSSQSGKQMNFGPNSSTANVNRSSRQISPPTAIPNTSRSSSTNNPLPISTHRQSAVSSAVYPLVQRSMHPSSVNTLPTFYSHILNPAQPLDAEWSSSSGRHGENHKIQNFTNSQQHSLRSNIVSSASSSLDHEQLNVSQAAKSTVVVPTNNQQPLAHIANAKPSNVIRQSDHSSFPNTTTTTTPNYLQQILPELNTTLRLIQQVSDSGGTLSTDVQNKILASIQQLVQQTTTIDSSVTNTCSTGAGSAAQATSNFNNYQSSNPSLQTSNQNLTTSWIPSQATTTAAINSNQVNSASLIHQSLFIDPQQQTSNQQLIDPVTQQVSQSSTTVASKFTVAPAKLEDDEPQIMTGNSVINQRQTQIPPPRPPRQQQPVNFDRQQIVTDISSSSSCTNATPFLVNPMQPSLNSIQQSDVNASFINQQTGLNPQITSINATTPTALVTTSTNLPYCPQIHSVPPGHR